MGDPMDFMDDAALAELAAVEAAALARRRNRSPAGPARPSSAAAARPGPAGPGGAPHKWSTSSSDNFRLQAAPAGARAAPAGQRPPGPAPQGPFETFRRPPAQQPHGQSGYNARPPGPPASAAARPAADAHRASIPLAQRQQHARHAAPQPQPQPRPAPSGNPLSLAQRRQAAAQGRAPPPGPPPRPQEQPAAPPRAVIDLTGPGPPASVRPPAGAGAPMKTTLQVGPSEGRCGVAERQQAARERALQPRQVDPAAAKAPMGTARVKLAVNQHGKITVHLYGEVMAKQALLSAVRAMPGAKPGAAGDWEVWPAQHDKLVQVLKGAGARNVVEVEKLPLKVLKGMGKGLQKAAAEMQEVSANIPESMSSRLMTFQKEGVHFGLQHAGRVLIADEMGLGKTVQALALCAAYKKDRPCLIVCPSSVRSAWADALYEWLQKVEDKDVSLVMSMQGADLDREYVVVSYEYITRHQDLLLKKKFKTIVLDEAHYIKNHKAKRSQAAVKLAQGAERAILLTGTPVMAKPIELLQQLRALHPKLFTNIKDYGKRYCESDTPLFGQKFGQYRGAKNIDELYHVLTSGIMVRRLKKDVLTQLPAKRRQQVQLRLGADGMRALRKISGQMDKVRAMMRAGKDLAELRQENNALLMQLYVKSAEAKTAAVTEYVKMLVESELKFLVFGHHQLMLDAIECCLREKKVKFIRIDGKTPQRARGGLVKTFQEQEDCLVAVLSFGAASEGITLTAASTVVMAELNWKPGTLVQAEDRVHRVGQAASVNIHYLHAEDTIDDIIWPNVQNKLELVGQMLDGKNDGRMSISPLVRNPGQRTLHKHLQKTGTTGPVPEPGPASAPALPGSSKPDVGQGTLMDAGFAAGGRPNAMQLPRAGAAGPRPPSGNQTLTAMKSPSKRPWEAMGVADDPGLDAELGADLPPGRCAICRDFQTQCVNCNPEKGLAAKRALKKKQPAWGKKKANPTSKWWG